MSPWNKWASGYNWKSSDMGGHKASTTTRLHHMRLTTRNLLKLSLWYFNFLKQQGVYIVQHKSKLKQYNIYILKISFFFWIRVSAILLWNRLKTVSLAETALNCVKVLLVSSYSLQMTNNIHTKPQQWHQEESKRFLGRKRFIYWHSSQGLGIWNNFENVQLLSPV